MWWIIIAVLLLLLVLVAFAGWMMFNFSIIRKPHRPWKELPESHPEHEFRKASLQGIEYLKNQKMEKWEMTSFDGLKLAAYYWPAENNPEKKALIAMHGYHSHDMIDFARSARFFHEAGYDVLLPDQRCHGESEGKYICFGTKEKFDCRDWAVRLTERLGSDARIVLMGVSMGSSTVTFALGTELPGTVKAVIADCGFTSPRDIFVHVLKRDYKVGKFPLIHTQKFFCHHVAGFDIDESTLDVLEDNETPILFVHGGKDDFVPTVMSHRNFLANKSDLKEILIIGPAPHAQCVNTDPEKCKKTMLAFCEKYV